MIARTVLFSLFLGAFLTACGSSKPSERQARQAVVTMIERDMSTDVRRVKSFRLGSCQSAQGAPGVVCDVSAEFDIETGSSRQPTIAVPIQGAMRFSKVNGTWRATHR